MRPADNINELIQKLKLKASTDLDRRVHNDVSMALAKSDKTQWVRTEPNVWRLIMRNSITKLIAAIMIIVVLIGISRSLLALRRVFERLRNRFPSPA